MTISERPMRVRSAGTAMAAGGARSGGGSFVTKRTCTWREGSSSIAATADGRRARRWWRRGGGGGKGRRRVLAFWEFERWVPGFIWLGFQWSLVPMFSDRGCGMAEWGIGDWECCFAVSPSEYFQFKIHIFVTPDELIVLYCVLINRTDII